MSALRRESSLPWRLIARWASERHRTVLGIAALLAGVSVFGAARLRPVASIDAMLDASHPPVQALQRMSEHFPAMEELIVLVSVPDDGRVDADAAEALLDFARRLEQAVTEDEAIAPMCRAVLYRPSAAMRRFVEEVMLPNALLYLDDDLLEALAARLKPSAMRKQLRLAYERLTVPGASGALAGILTRDPLALREVLMSALPFAQSGAARHEGFFSPDGRRLLIRLRGTRPASDLDYADAFTRAVRRLAVEVNESDLTLDFAGAYAIASTSQRAIRRDMIISIVLSVLFLHGLYLIVYRTFWSLPLALTPVGLGILCAFAVFGVLEMRLTPLTAVIGAILAGLGVDYSIHFLTHYRKERTQGVAHESAVYATLCAIGPALLAACVTTVVGFLAISASGVRALREFGLLGALGLGLTLPATLVILPALLRMLVRDDRNASLPGRSTLSVVTAVVQHVTRNQRKFLVAGTIVFLFALSMLGRVARSGVMYEDDLSVMHPRPNPPLETQHRIAKLFDVSPDSLFVYIEAATPEILIERSHHVHERLELLAADSPYVAGSFGLATLLPHPKALEKRRALLERFDADRILADFQRAVAESPFRPDAFLAFESFLRRLCAPDRTPDLSDLLRFEGVADDVLAVDDAGRYASVTTVRTRAALVDRRSRDEVIEAVRTAIGDVPGATLTGLTVVGHDTERTIRHDLSILLVIAFALVIGWLTVYFRSIRSTLLALVPACFGIVVMLACMSLIGLKWNTVNVIALPLLAGIGVDDGLFLVSLSRRAPVTSLDAARRMDSLTAACHAIVMTSLTTVLTFATLAFTRTPAIASLGWIMGIGVAASLAGAVSVLVPLLTVRSSVRENRRRL